MAKSKSTTAEQIDLYDLTRKLRQMKAAINAISGGGFESFMELNDQLKDD